MLSHGRFDDAAVIMAELHTGIPHCTGRMEGKAVAWLPHRAAVITPPAIVAGQP